MGGRNARRGGDSLHVFERLPKAAGVHCSLNCNLFIYLFFELQFKRRIRRLPGKERWAEEEGEKSGALRNHPQTFDSKRDFRQ